MAQLCREAEALRELRARIVLIAFGTLPDTERWLADVCPSLCLLRDPERTVYQAFDLEHSFLRALSPRTLLAYARWFAAGRKMHGLQGDAAQLGGNFIVDPEGVLRLAHRSRDTLDRPSVAEILTCLRRIRDGGAALDRASES